MIKRGKVSDAVCLVDLNDGASNFQLIFLQEKHDVIPMNRLKVLIIVPYIVNVEMMREVRMCRVLYRSLWLEKGQLGNKVITQKTHRGLA